MQTIEASKNEHQWPRHAVKSVETRKRDLVVRIADWTRDRQEPSYDVEVYIGGVFDFNESECFTFWSFTEKGLTREAAKRASKDAAIKYAAAQIAKLL